MSGPDKSNADDRNERRDIGVPDSASWSISAAWNYFVEDVGKR